MRLHLSALAAGLLFGGLAAQAAERLQAHTGARVRRLRVEDFGAQQFE